MTFPPDVGPGTTPPKLPKYRTRQIQCHVFINGTALADVLWVRCRFSLAEPVASAQFMCPVRHGNYNDDVQIDAGAIPGFGVAMRFKGRMRNPSAELWPAAVTHNVVGELQKAAEYFNGEDNLAVGGLTVMEILGRSPSVPIDSSTNNFHGYTPNQWTGTSKAIIQAVLDKARVFYSSADIEGSSVVYGTTFHAFIWSAGTPTVDSITGSVTVQNPLAPQQAGESALAYIQRYDQVDAVWGGDANPNFGGFYRLVEGVGSRVQRHRVGGRPSTPTPFALIEGVNILDGATMERQFPTGNRMLVSGGDYGGITGVVRFSADRNNPFMPQDQPFYGANSPSSSMIEHPDRNFSAIFGWGQNCEVVAEAALLEVNKETPVGTIQTPDDDLYTPAVSVTVNSARLLTAGLPLSEPFWVQSLTIDCGHGPKGEPIFTQTLELQGGGLE